MSRAGQVLSGIYELPAARRILPFEGLRGLAVLLTFFVHSRAAFLPLFQPDNLTSIASHALWSIGHSGVDLFFVLSGYLIYGGLIAKPIRYWRYLKRRIERIYPTFFTVLVVYLMLSVAFPSRSKLPAGAWNAGVYIAQNVLLLPGIFAIEPIVTVAWSLSYELAFYLFVPLIVWLFGLRAWSGGGRTVLFAGMTVCACIAYLAFGRHIQAVMFIAGALVAEATQRPWPAPTVRRAECAAVIVLLAAIPLLYIIEIHLGAMRDFFAGSSRLVQIVRSGALFIGFGLLVFVCLTTGTRSGALFSWTPLRWLGNMSYSYYLIHGLTINAAAIVLGYAITTPGGVAAGVLYWVATVVVFVATLASSTLLFVTVERPLSIRSKNAKPRIVEAGGSGLSNARASDVVFMGAARRTAGAGRPLSGSVALSSPRCETGDEYHAPTICSGVMAQRDRRSSMFVTSPRQKSRASDGAVKVMLVALTVPTRLGAEPAQRWLGLSDAVSTRIEPVNRSPATVPFRPPLAPSAATKVPDNWSPV